MHRKKGYDLRALAAKVGVHFTYLSKVKNEKLDFRDYPSSGLIIRLTVALDADADKLLILANKVPERIRRRVLERPDAFRKLVELDNVALNRLLGCLDRHVQGKAKGR